MKAKTIARLTRILIAIVVAFIFAVPILAGANNFQLTGGQIVGTDSTYELDEMSASDVSTNITNAVADNDQNYTISYTYTDGSKKVYDLELKGKGESDKKSAIDAAASAILANHKPGTKATLLDSDGKIVGQQMIIANKDMMESTMWTGMKLSKSAVNAFCPEVSLCTRNGDELIKISDIEITPMDDSFLVKIKIPYIVLMPAIAQNNNMTLAIGLEYNSFFTLDLSLDIPASMFLGDTEIPEIHVNPDATGFNVDISAIGIGEMSATINDIEIKVDSSGVLSITTKNGKPLVTELESYRNDKGELVFTYGSPPETYVMDKEMSDSLIKITKSIMEGA